MRRRSLAAGKRHQHRLPRRRRERDDGLRLRGVEREVGAGARPADGARGGVIRASRLLCARGRATCKLACGSWRALLTVGALAAAVRASRVKGSEPQACTAARVADLRRPAAQRAGADGLSATREVALYLGASCSLAPSGWGGAPMRERGCVLVAWRRAEAPEASAPSHPRARGNLARAGDRDHRAHRTARCELAFRGRRRACPTAVAARRGSCCCSSPSSAGWTNWPEGNQCGPRLAPLWCSRPPRPRALQRERRPAAASPAGKPGGGAALNPGGARASRAASHPRRTLGGEQVTGGGGGGEGRERWEKGSMTAHARAKRR